MRLHLPSPGEINRSKQLIEQLEKDMGALKGKIANITRTEELEFQKYERDMFLNRQRIEQELIKLRKEYNEERERKSKHIRAIVDPLERERSSLEGIVFEERAFISPIRKLPIELFSEIFLYCVLGNGTRRSILCKVCRSWRAIVYRTSRIWCDIDMSLWEDQAPEDFKARLDLAGKLPLNVKLGPEGWDADQDSIEYVHRELAKSGTERWRSLSIHLDTLKMLVGIYSGEFSSLSQLVIEGVPESPHQTDSQDVLTLIANSTPPLKTLTVRQADHIPCFTGDVPALRSLSSITCTAAFLSNLAMHTLAQTITSIKITGALPSSVIEATFNKVTNAELQLCDIEHTTSFPNVVHLVIKGVFFDVNAIPTAKFPHLQTLDIKASDPIVLKAFSAPRLENLFIRQTWEESRRPNKSESILGVFEGNLLSMAPTTLVFDFYASHLAVLSVLIAWPQLQCATLCRRKEPDEPPGFMNALTEVDGETQTPTLCPVLLNLSFTGLKLNRRTYSQWKNDSRQLFKSRPLLTSVVCSWMKKTSVFRRDILTDSTKADNCSYDSGDSESSSFIYHSSSSS